MNLERKTTEFAHDEMKVHELAQFYQNEHAEVSIDYVQFQPGKSQAHRHPGVASLFAIISGKGKVRVGNAYIPYDATNKAQLHSPIYTPPGEVHQVIAETPTNLISIQSPPIKDGDELRYEVVD